ncbi:MAG TPA: hypothetical protein VJI73_00410 [Candidatus Paceibacterota bacterium]
MPNKIEGNVPPVEEFDEEGNEIKPLEPERTREEMQQSELKGFIELHEFPNRTKVMKSRKAKDIDGNPLPLDKTLFYDPSEPVRMRGETIYGRYGDEQGNYYWVKTEMLITAQAECTGMQKQDHNFDPISRHEKYYF